MIKVNKFVSLIAFLGIVTADYATCSVRPRSDSQEAMALPFMSLTLPVNSIPITKKTPEKVDSFKTLTLRGTLAEDASTDDVITQICARVNCDNIVCLTLNECNWSLASKILPHFKKLEKLVIFGHQEQKPLDTEKAHIIDSVCALLDNRTLTELIIRNADFNDTNAETIVNRIASDKPLEVLDFSDNRIADTGATRISKLIKENHNLQIVNLQNNDIHEASGLYLYEATYDLPQIPEIILGSRPASGQGCMV